MSEWLDLMLDEIARKRREEQEARRELERRGADQQEAPQRQPDNAQSK